MAPYASVRHVSGMAESSEAENDHSPRHSRSPLLRSVRRRRVSLTSSSPFVMDSERCGSLVALCSQSALRAITSHCAWRLSILMTAESSEGVVSPLPARVPFSNCVLSRGAGTVSWSGGRQCGASPRPTCEHVAPAGLPLLPFTMKVPPAPTTFSASTVASQPSGRVLRVGRRVFHRQSHHSAKSARADTMYRHPSRSMKTLQ